jgi:hypothetical protein
MNLETEHRFRRYDRQLVRLELLRQKEYGQSWTAWTLRDIAKWIKRRLRELVKDGGKGAA